MTKSPRILYIFGNNPDDTIFAFTGLNSDFVWGGFNDEVAKGVIPIIITGLREYWEPGPWPLAYMAYVPEPIAKMCLYLLENPDYTSQAWKDIRDSLLAGERAPVNLDSVLMTRKIWASLMGSAPAKITKGEMECFVITAPTGLGAITVKNHEVTLRLGNVKITKNLIFKLVEDMSGLLSGNAILVDNPGLIMEYSSRDKTEFEVGKIPEDVITSVMTGVPSTAMTALN
jgi:hypothetical protein